MYCQTHFKTPPESSIFVAQFVAAAAVGRLAQCLLVETSEVSPACLPAPSSVVLYAILEYVHASKEHDVDDDSLSRTTGAAPRRTGGACFSLRPMLIVTLIVPQTALAHFIGPLSSLCRSLAGFFSTAKTSTCRSMQ
ncbi:unnamed protein product [Heligmosomoides polygyrus]|uniref:Secreted protein n=1 Tax=Heligmosomoides polygyrus TaxID=6339 RepID=A0A183FFZ5_HELPZ|nr:unnamed protein product [Heligmosomoides polygyrus]